MRTTIKLICVLATLLLGNIQTYAQEKVNINYISGEVFCSISINGIKFTDIEATKGNKQKLSALMNLDFRVRNSTDPNLGIELRNSSMYFRFDDYTDTGNSYELTRYTIDNNQATFSIGDKVLRIGDPISKLGAVKTSIIDGIKTVLYASQIADSESLSIEFDSNNNISKIEYIVFD